MSCSKCGSVNTSCGCKDSAYTTPKVYTCPPDTSCPQPVRCSEFMDAACIFLNDGIADAGIQPGSSLESIVQQLILLVTNPGCVDAPGGVPGGGTVTFIDAVWPGNAITIAGGPISNSGTFVFNGNGTSNQYIDGQGNLQNFPAISGPVEFQTNGTPNSAQDLLNLVAGTGVTLTESGGSVTIDVDANVYTVDNGLSADPTDPNNFQLGSETSPGAPLIHDTYIAGAQFRFEINNTNSMFLQGNRVDIEGAAAGAMLLSTGGTNENSVEVDGTEVAIESTGAGATRIFLDPAKIRVQTPLFNTKANNDVLTLIDSATGEVEFMPPTGILLQTDGVDNADQTYLNLIPGNGIVLTNTAGDVTIDGPTFQTDGTDNSTQTLLNLVPGTGITLTESGGSVTIDAAAPAINLTTNDFGGPATYNPLTGDLNIPVYQTQLDIQEEGTGIAINPDFLNFIGDAVTVTLSGTGADVTITGGTPYVVENGLHAFGDIPGESPADPFLFHLGGNLVENTEINLDTAYDLDVLADTGKKMLHLEFGVARIGDIDDASSTGLNTYADIGQSFKVRYSGVDRGLDIDKGAGYWAMGDLDNTNLGSKIEINDLGQKIEILGKVGSTYNRRGFYLTYGGSIVLSLGDIDNSLNGTGYTLDDLSELHTFTKRLKLSNYNNSTAYQSWTAPVPGTAGAPVGVLNVDNQGNVFVGSGTALAIEVDGTPLSSSTLLNFVPSTDIGVTDLGGGFVQFTLVNPLPVYTVDNGLSPDLLDSNNFQLGGILIKDTLIDTATHYLEVSGALASPNGVFRVEATGSAPFHAAAYFQMNTTGAAVWASSDGSGVYGTGNGAGVEGISVAGFGGNFQSTSGIGLNAVSVSNVATRLSISPSTGNDIQPIASANRLTSGTAADGIGLSYDFYVQDASNLTSSTNKIISKWAIAATSTRTAQFEIQGTNSGTTQTQFTILGSGTSGPGGAWSLTPGQIKFNRYAGGTIYKSATDLSTNSGFNLGIDADGNIWATDFSTGTGGTGVSSISIGTLTNGASATVNNPSGPSATINITGQNAYTQIAADSGTASADTFNSQFSVIGADGITTSVANGTMPASDVITVTGPDKYLNFVTKNISGTTIATYTPTIWNETLNIQAGTGITITNGGSANTIVISSTGGSGTGSVTNVSGTNANGFTFTITNPTTTPDITIGTSVTGILVGDGSGGLTSVSTGGGSGVLTYNSTTNSYSFTTLPTVNDGAIVVGATAALATGLAAALQNSAGGAFTANKADSSTYRVSVGPALSNLATYMTQALPANPTAGAGVLATRPVYIRKTGVDIYTDATPVTTFSPGTTGFTVTSGFSTATTLGINENVVLGGVLSVTNGGTGTSTAPGEGQILVGNSTGGFNVVTISGSGGTTVTTNAGGITISSSPGSVIARSGTYVNVDGSVRLGSGAQDADPPAAVAPSPLLERSIVRLNSWLFRLADGTDGVVNDLGFDVSDLAGVKRGYLGTPTKGFWFSSNVATAVAPTSAFQGFVYGGQTSNAFPTNMSGFLFTPSGSAAFPATFSGFGVDTGNSRTVTGFPGTSVYEVINRTNNIINQHGLWGGTGGAADFLMYQANATAKTISIGDVSLLGGQTRFQIDDANLRYNFRKGNIYGTDYGTATPVGIDAGQIARYVLGTSSNGKFYEIPAVSIGSIVVGATNYTPTTLATAGAPNALTIVGTGSVGVTLAGSTVTINGTGATAFPYWSTLSFAVSAGSTGRINNSTSGTSTVIPEAIGANTLNIQAGNNIDISTVDATTNRVVISAIVPTAGVSFGTVNLTATGTGTVTGQTSIVANTTSGSLGLVAGAGITFAGNSTNDTITIGTTLGFTSIVGSAGGTVSVTVNNTTGVATITGPNIWNTIAVPTPGTGLPAQTPLTPQIPLDTLNLAAGSGITIATNSTTDTITISATAGTPVNAWYTIAVANGSAAGGTTSLTPNLNQDTLTIAGGTGISVSTNPGAFTDRVVVTNTGVTGITTTGTGGTTLTGGVTLTAGTNVSLSTTGNTITINGAAGTALTANQGIEIVSNVILLGTAASGANPFTSNRFVTTAANTLNISGTPGTNQPTVSISATPAGTGSIAIRATNTGSGHGVRASSAGDATNTSHAGLFVHTGTNAVEQDILKLVRGSNFTSGTGIGFYSADATKNGFVGYNTDGYVAKVSAGLAPGTRHQIYTTGQHRFNNYISSASFPITPVYADYHNGLALVVDSNASAGDTGKVVTMPLVSAYLSSSATINPNALNITGGPTSYTKVGNVVTVMLTVQFTYTSNPAGSIVTINLGLPRNGLTNTQIDPFPTNLLHSLSWQSFTSMSLFTGYTASISGSNVVILLTRTGTAIPNITHTFSFIYTYVASPTAP